MADHLKLRHVTCKAGTGLVLHVNILVTSPLLSLMVQSMQTER